MTLKQEEPIAFVLILVFIVGLLPVVGSSFFVKNKLLWLTFCYFWPSQFIIIIYGILNTVGPRYGAPNGKPKIIRVKVFSR